MLTKRRGKLFALEVEWSCSQCIIVIKSVYDKNDNFALLIPHHVSIVLTNGPPLLNSVPGCPIPNPRCMLRILAQRNHSKFAATPSTPFARRCLFWPNIKNCLKEFVQKSGMPYRIKRYNIYICFFRFNPPSYWSFLRMSMDNSFLKAHHSTAKHWTKGNSNLVCYSGYNIACQVVN